MNVIRTRVALPRRRRLSRTAPVVAIAGGLTVALGAGVAYGTTVGFAENQVGQEYRDGLQISSNQILKPLGERLTTPYGKLMGSTVSPDGRFLAATATDRGVALQVFDLSTYRLVWRAGTAAGVDARLSDSSVGQESPLYSPDGAFLWMPNRTGLTRFPVNADGSLGAGTKVTLPTVDGHTALTAGLAYSPDGRTLYAAVNGQNTVVAIDPSTGAVTHTWAVGIAPRALRFVGTTLYVSDEGGRQAKPDEPTQDSYGSAVPADPVKGTSTTGVVSVIDTASPDSVVAQLDVGLHPTAMHVDGRVLYVVNTNDDTVSVIDTKLNKVVQTITTQPWQGSATGYAPTAVTVHDGHLLVSTADQPDGSG